MVITRSHKAPSEAAPVTVASSSRGESTQATAAADAVRLTAEPPTTGRPTASTMKSQDVRKDAQQASTERTSDETTNATTTTPSIMEMTSGTTTEPSTVQVRNRTATITRGAAQKIDPEPIPARTKTRTSTSRARKRELLKAREELLQKEVELAAARVSLLEAEEESEEDSMAEERHDRTWSWVNDQEALALTMEPHREEPQRQDLPPAVPVIAPNRADQPTVAGQDVQIDRPQALSRDDTLKELAAAIALAARSAQPPAIMTRPYQELPVFNGASQDWLPFKAAFEETRGTYNNADNLARLRRGIKGAAKEAVQCLFVGRTTPVEVMQLLETRFGRPDAIVISEMEKLRNLPKLVEGARETCVYASKVANIIATVRALNRTQYLFNPEIVRQVTDKLPPTLRYRYYDFAADASADEPDLVRLSRFLQITAERCGAYAPAEQIASSDRRENGAASGAAGAKKRSYAVTEDAAAEEGECLICKKGKHKNEDCIILKKMQVPERWENAKRLNLCFRCLCKRKFKHTCKARKCEIDGCKYMHHRLLHSSSPRPAKVEEPEKESTAIVASARAMNRSAILKIVPVEVSGPKGTIETYALLDDGSTCTLVEEEIAKSIGATGPRERLRIKGVAGARVDQEQSATVTFKIRGRNGSHRNIVARTMRGLRLSPQSIDSKISDCEHLSDILSEIVYSEGKPTILIGQDYWHLLIVHATRRGIRTQPVASLTDLGWVLHGAMEVRQNKKRAYRVSHLFENNSGNMEQLMEEHFALESLGVAPKRARTEGEARALHILEQDSARTKDGAWQTSLLWADSEQTPPPSYNTALRRLDLVEKKIDKDPRIKARYSEEIDKLIASGYAEIAPPLTNDRVWYLPHFGVTHPEKPEKLRIVHDAAAETRGVSLNNMLLAGPDLLQSLPGVLMRFRQRKIAVTADIKEMFMRIKIRERDRDMQRFLWRGDRRTGPPIEYRMTRVIFGAKSSPCTAIYIKNRNAAEYAETYPLAATTIEKNHYMDDYINSYDNEDDAIEISHQIEEIHRSGNFHLAKWASNSSRVLNSLAPEENRNTVSLDPEKILGMVWRPREDTLSFNINLKRIPMELLENNKTPTKREALKLIMSLYDPLGLATPITVQGKRILQDTWRRGTDWDQKLDDVEAAAWHLWMADVKRLQSLAVPRCHAHLSSNEDRELHVFVDASAEAYAAAIYWKIGSSVSLIAGKARVAPVNKVTSIPRLELQAAVLGCRLARTAIEEYEFKPTRRVFWSDSRTVLSWIRTGPRAYKPFVSHRLAEIAECTKTNEWRWVPTKDNVADDATRKAPPSFATTHRWFVGPAFLRLDEEKWPIEEQRLPSPPTGEERTHTLKQSSNSLRDGLPQIGRFSSWLRLIRSTGRVLQAIDRMRPQHRCAATRMRTQTNADADPTWGKIAKKIVKPQKRPTKEIENKYVLLEAEYLGRAEELWVRAVQQEAFSAEIEAMQRERPLPSGSRLNKLAVEMNEKGIVVLKSRIAAAEDITTSQRQPAIIDGDHPWARLYIAWTHRQLHHCGFETTATEVRQHYWVLRLRNATRGVIAQCQVCRLRRAMPAQPSTGNHPPTRLAHHKRAFTFTGLDYFGPLFVTVGRTRQKRYGALFTCLTTRAVHLEVAGSLTTDSAVMALRRFISRRGCPAEIWSDQGTNLRGADVELRRAAADATHAEATVRAIKWRYIPPSAPFMGGAWERMVRSVKNALEATLRERAPKEEVLATLLAEAEYTVNSRPLTHLSLEPGDEGPLTPNHFILGGPARVPLPGVFNEGEAAGRREWRASQALADMFWARWVREYLPELQHRREPRASGGALQIGDLVLVADGTLPRNSWPRGIIIAVYPGPDGEVRAVDVQTARGTLRRPTKKLAILRVDAPGS